MDREIYIIAHDIRSAHNIGALFRLCDGMAVKHLYITGYSPYPQTANDSRLPHIQTKVSKAIHKTALGAEQNISWSHTDFATAHTELSSNNIPLIALEQTPSSVSLPRWKPSQRFALLLGSEVEGVSSGLLKHADSTVEIPMLGSKESHNVIQATAIALYHCRFIA